MYTKHCIKHLRKKYLNITYLEYWKRTPNFVFRIGRLGTYLLNWLYVRLLRKYVYEKTLIPN